MCVYWSILAVWQNFIGIFLNIIWKKCLIIYNGLSRAAIKNQFHCIYVWGPIWLTCCVFKITTIYYLIEISIYRFQWYDLQVSHVTQVSKHKCTATAGARAVSFLCQSREKQSYLEKTIFENKTIDIRQSYQCENFLFFLSIACKNKHGSTNCWYDINHFVHHRIDRFKVFKPGLNRDDKKSALGNRQIIVTFATTINVRCQNRNLDRNICSELYNTFVMF